MKSIYKEYNKLNNMEKKCKSKLDKLDKIEQKKLPKGYNRKESFLQVGLINFIFGAFTIIAYAYLENILVFMPFILFSVFKALNSKESEYLWLGVTLLQIGLFVIETSQSINLEQFNIFALYIIVVFMYSIGCFLRYCFYNNKANNEILNENKKLDSEKTKYTRKLISIYHGLNSLDEKIIKDDEKIMNVLSLKENDENYFIFKRIESHLENKKNNIIREESEKIDVKSFFENRISKQLAIENV